MLTRRRIRRWIGVGTPLAALLLSASCSGLISRIEGPRSTEIESEAWSYGRSEGTLTRTPHYLLYTTCRHPAFVKALPDFMETCYEAYGELLPPAKAPGEPMKAYLFQSRPDWERFTKEFSPARAPTYLKIRRGGYSERGVTVSHYSSQRGTLSIVAHEGLHQYLEATGRGRIPAWINEGLACYFESFDLVDNRPVFTPERNTLRAPSLREALQQDDLIPLKEILGTNAGAAVHRTTGHVRNYYAQEWSLVLFLLSDDAPSNYREGFEKLLNDLGTVTMEQRATSRLNALADGGTISSGEAVFRVYITEDLDQFDADYRAFLIKLLKLHV
ncbi:MAG TPA: DUF1570 domain-containing protein [Phycisphaerae bacterium]|nr:DUF1570 domain-containing protein [Phycisphaerae bacterium]HRW52789.1 DUF1570 domain-containing protein [Phycisphaerae bacterium]